MNSEVSSGPSATSGIEEKERWRRGGVQREGIRELETRGTVFSKCVIIIACGNIILSFSKNLS